MRRFIFGGCQAIVKFFITVAVRSFLVGSSWGSRARVVTRPR